MAGSDVRQATDMHEVLLNWSDFLSKTRATRASHLQFGQQVRRFHALRCFELRLVVVLVLVLRNFTYSTEGVEVNHLASSDLARSYPLTPCSCWSLRDLISVLVSDPSCSVLRRSTALLHRLLLHRRSLLRCCSTGSYSVRNHVCLLNT